MSELEPMSCAVTAAENGARWWDTAAQVQRAKRGPAVDHGEMYRLAGEVVSTLRALEELAGALVRQSSSYGEGRRLRDDAGTDPMARLEDAGVAALHLGDDLVIALGHANAFWSAIGHIGLDYDPAADENNDEQDDPTDEQDDPTDDLRGKRAPGPGAGGGWSR